MVVRKRGSLYMDRNAIWFYLMGFFMGRMIAKGELNQFLFGAMTIITIVLPFSLTKYRFGTRKALVTVGLTLSIMILTISMTRVVRELRSVYYSEPIFYSKMNAYIFRDSRWQAQLDPIWFEKKRTLIARYTLDLQRMRSVCGDPVRYREIARNYNLAIGQYNKVIVGSMVGSQYAEPVRQLLIEQFNDQLAPCGSVFKPLSFLCCCYR